MFVVVVVKLGYWASLIIAADFILVITMYPSVLMFHHLYFKECEAKYFCCCCHGGCKCGGDGGAPGDAKRQNSKQGVELPNATPLPNDSNPPPGKTSTGTSGTTGGDGGDGDGDDEEREVPPQLSRARSVEEQAHEYRAIEQFCGMRWPKIIGKYKYITLGVFAAISAISLWLMITGIEPLEEAEGRYWRVCVDVVLFFVWYSPVNILALMDDIVQCHFVFILL